MKAWAQTRAHILNEDTMIGQCPRDPSAIAGMSDGGVFLTNVKPNLNPREARQLAYALCEAADEQERYMAS